MPPSLPGGPASPWELWFWQSSPAARSLRSRRRRQNYNSRQARAAQAQYMRRGRGAGRCAACRRCAGATARLVSGEPCGRRAAPAPWPRKVTRGRPGSDAVAAATVPSPRGCDLRPRGRRDSATPYRCPLPCGALVLGTRFHSPWASLRPGIGRALRRWVLFLLESLDSSFGFRARDL